MSVIDCKWMIANLLEKVGCLSEERLSAGTKYRLMGVVADISCFKTGRTGLIKNHG